MTMDIKEFFHDFRQELLSGAEAKMDFLEAEFALHVSKELGESGAIEGFEACHYKAPRGMRVDGYWCNDDDITLDLFIVDSANRESLESLTRTDVEALFKRVENFFIASAQKELYYELEETSQGYGLARDISKRLHSVSKVNFYLLSERRLSEKIQAINEKQVENWTFSYHVWDIVRLHRIATSKGAKEELIIDFKEMFDKKIPCLPAHIDSADYKSYLLVLPGDMLSDLYGLYGGRLLEQNVRCFLQARGKVNKGIRTTILTEPQMFFAYNNGITATAKNVVTETDEDGIYIKEIRDLQIVNGGQTTASIFHTQRKDKASLKNIFVQMKLSIVDAEKGETVIPLISEYANTQNKVNAADFFANHPFHIRLEEFSRRLWAPTQQGAVRETKWFYERARGQYIDAQAKLSHSEKRKFLNENPKPQMFTKTDLAKFENVWDGDPIHVNMGAQANFAQYAKRIGQMWKTDEQQVNELYYKHAVARAILFRKTEKMVSAQTWYDGGYRANIVAYTLAMLGKLCSDNNTSIDFMAIWEKQDISDDVMDALEITAELVYYDITNPPPGMSNVSQWCKKEMCWGRLQQKITALRESLPQQFLENLVSKEEITHEKKSAVSVQKIDNGIDAQATVVKIPPKSWAFILSEGQEKHLFSPKEVDILQIATQIPNKLPTEKQCGVLLEVLEKIVSEGITVPR